MIRFSRTGLATALFALSSLLIVVSIWYPFGFSLGGLLEEWDFIRALMGQPGYWNSFPGNPGSEFFAARPLQVTPFWLAHLMAPHSFLGFHILLIAACFLRLFAGAVIGRFLFESRFHAVLFGILAFVFPADTQQLAFRTINISCSLALALCGSAALLTAVDTPERRHRCWLWAISVATYVCAVFIYEPTITLYAIPPLLILAREGAGSLQTIRSRRNLLAAWLIAPIVNILYFAYTIYIFKSGYEVSSAPNGMLAGIRGNLHYILDSLAFRLFLDSWRSAFSFAREIGSWPYFILIALILLAGFGVLSLRREASVRWPYALRLIVAGAVIGVLAYLPFMVAESHMVITQRTMMAPQFGGALVIAAVLLAVLGRYRLPLVIASAALIFVGLVAQIYQMDIYSRLYTGILRPYLAMIVDRADTTKNVHLVIDRTGHGGHLGGLYVTTAINGPPARMNDGGQSFILCLETPATVDMPSAQCERRGDQWTIRRAGLPDMTLPASQVDALEFGPDFDPNYQGVKGVWTDLGSFTASKSLFRRDSDQDDRFVCVPGSMWGYFDYCRTTGWPDATPTRVGRHIVNYLTDQSPEASFLFAMKPAAGPYRFRARTLAAADPATLKAMKILVNGHEVNFSWQAPDLILANVAPQYLIEGTNIITFRNANSDGRRVALLLTRVSLMPSAGADAASD